MSGLFQLVAFVLVWIACVTIFHDWMELGGGWLMMAGALSFFIAGFAARIVNFA